MAVWSPRIPGDTTSSQLVISHLWLIMFPNYVVSSSLFKVSLWVMVLPTQVLTSMAILSVLGLSYYVILLLTTPLIKYFNMFVKTAIG